jgi:hypothetical protein
MLIALTAATSLVETSPAASIHVDDDGAPGGDGTSQFPFNNVPAAMAAARAVTGPVTIKVAPGDYALAETLVIDRSVDLRGSTEPVQDLDGWPTGEVVSGTATRLFASSPAMARLLLVERADATVVDDVRIRGFVLEATSAGISILLNRAQDYWIDNNVFRTPAQFGLQSVASTGQVTGNHFSGVGTGAIFTGGYPESPSHVVFQGNRAVRNSIGGVLLNGASINIPELGDEVHGIVRDNDLSENIGGQGFGFRAFILRRDLGLPGDQQSSASVFAIVQGNRIVGNTAGIQIDAGFPYRRVGTLCDGRVYSGVMNLHFAGNTIAGNLSRSLVTFTRGPAALNPLILSQWQYLHGATYTLSDPDGILADALIDNPETDPIVGPCPGDATHEALGNTLTYNGRLLSGRNF